MSGSANSIADALFPQVRQRLLATLFGQPERSFYANELVRVADSGIGAVQRELASLSDCGLLTVERRGNQKHYQANAAAPIFDELCAIVQKTFGIAGVLRAALAPMEARIEQAFVFGSLAAGTAHAGSDIDLMIVADDLPLETVLTALTPLESRLGRRLNPTLYTPAEFVRRVEAGNPFLAKVLAGPRLPLIGKDHGPD